jgi:uncharacterized Ntn-hydrolase superfamily protein
VLVVALSLGLHTGAFADDATGTFSIVAFDPETQELGVAVQSRAFSVGAGVPWAEAGVGAIATQASTNESFGPRGLALLRSGYSAQQTLDMLLGEDSGRERRQLAIVDARGGVAAHTGAECLAWAGHIVEDALSAQGNILAGGDVVSEMVRAYRGTDGEMAERLLAALHAAQGAGGDKRGKQSAALLVVRPSAEYPEYRTRYVELRIEDHPSPIDELERVFRIHQASDLLRAHLRYAAHYDSLGNAEAAHRERSRIGATLRSTLQRPNASASTLNALAWYCATANMYLEESLEAAQRAVELEPENTGILDTLGETLFRLNRREDALEVIERALEIDPDDEYLKRQKERFRGR